MTGRCGVNGTKAILTAKSIENGVQVLMSTLRVTATSMYPNPSVICIHGDESRSKANFSVIGKHIILFYTFFHHLFYPIFRFVKSGRGEGRDREKGWALAPSVPRLYSDP